MRRRFNVNCGYGSANSTATVAQLKTLATIMIVLVVVDWIKHWSGWNREWIWWWARRRSILITFQSSFIILWGVSTAAFSIQVMRALCGLSRSSARLTFPHDFFRDLNTAGPLLWQNAIEQAYLLACNCDLFCRVLWLSNGPQITEIPKNPLANYYEQANILVDT